MEKQHPIGISIPLHCYFLSQNVYLFIVQYYICSDGTFILKLDFCVPRISRKRKFFSKFWSNEFSNFCYLLSNMIKNLVKKEEKSCSTFPLTWYIFPRWHFQKLKRLIQHYLLSCQLERSYSSSICKVLNLSSVPKLSVSIPRPKQLDEDVTDWADTKLEIAKSYWVRALCLGWNVNSSKLL